MSKQGIYVSRLAGNDTKTCGNVSSPCRTISYGIQQLSNEPYIYLDGTATMKNPYTCAPSNPGSPGIYLTKSVSFVSMNSRAYISCLHGNSWWVDGTKLKDGVRISISGLTFLNTSLKLFDALMVVNDTIFAETNRVSLSTQLVNQQVYNLSLNNVVFQKNAACITILNTNRGNNIAIFVNITNTLFYKNGNSSLPISPTLLLNARENLVNIHLTNCSFKKNTFKKSGMIIVLNLSGTTKVLLSQLRLEENSPTNSRINNKGGVFSFYSARVYISLENGFIHKTFAAFLHVGGYSTKINISNMEVDKFYSFTDGGGFFDLIQTDSCFLSIKNSSFRNGNNNGTGGVVLIIAPNLALTIENSIFQNVSNFGSGGVVVFIQSPNYSKKFVPLLRITNSSFLNCSSRTHGGVVFVFAQKLSAIIRDSIFLGNSAARFGGALYVYTKDMTEIILYNDDFLENSADDGGIVHAISYRKDSVFNLSVTNVTFVQNKLCTFSVQDCAYYAVVYLIARRPKIAVNFKNSHFIRNSAVKGSCIYIRCGQYLSNSVILDTCKFRENVVNAGTVMLLGQALFTCKNSIFASNSGISHRSVMVLSLNNSLISITNTRYLNNLCSALTVFVNGISALTISDSSFVRNTNKYGAGGAILTSSEQNPSKTYVNIRIERVLFQENVAAVGSVLYVISGKVLLKKCTFLNNFARFQGGQIVSYGPDSANFLLMHSVFRQTIRKFSTDDANEFGVTSFLRLYTTDTLTVLNTTFDQSTKLDEPLILVPTAYQMSFDNNSTSTCPLGNAIEKGNYFYARSDHRQVISLSLSCKECDYNFYSLQRGKARALNIDSSFNCTPCPRGANCVPAIKSKKNFWGYYASSNPPKLAFTICPFGYCKSPQTNSTEYNACQGKRTGVMCGMCSRGYTEAIWSTYCSPVEDCNDHWFWILFVALVVSMAVLLIFKPPLVKYSLQQIFWFKSFTSRRSAHSEAYHDLIQPLSVDESITQQNISLSSTEQLHQDKRQFSRLVDIIFYFYQIAQLLLASSSLTEFFDVQFLAPVLGFFNFQPSFKKEGFLCPFPGLTPATKMIFKIAPVFGTLLVVFLMYGVHSFFCRIKGAIRPAVARYLQTGIKTILLGYVTLATVSISLIRCVFVAGESRWFYNGNITCYQWWQYVALGFNVIFVIPFIFVLAVISFKLQHDNITITEFLLTMIFPLPFLMLWLLRFACSSAADNVEENQNLKALKEMLLAPYRQPNGASKQGALYWQSVLIARRFILVVIFCVITEPSIRLFCMTLVCVFVLFYHLKVKPFQNSFANNLESLSLSFLVILSLINLFKSVFVGSEQKIKGPLVIVFKVFQWLEILMLGLFPALLSLLLSFAVISISVRVLFICCRSIFKYLFRSCAQRWLSRDSARLLNVCEDND